MHKRAPVFSASIAAAFSLVIAPANAANFPVTGSITVNGDAGDLPAGGTFGDSTWDASAGTLSAGHFTFPQSSTVFTISGLGDVTVNYQFSQTNTSSVLVASDGSAAMTPVTAQLSIVSTSLPISVTPCVFDPIDLDLAGTASAAGLDLEDREFTVPPTTATCGGFASQINGSIAGSSNSIALHLDGDFTPPADDDKIFIDGFDG